MYTWYYDYLLELHGLVFKNDLILFKTVPYYLANIGLDYFLLFSVFTQLFVTIAIIYPFLPKVPSTNTKTVKVA